jgi:hypothetical protein
MIMLLMIMLLMMIPPPLFTCTGFDAADGDPLGECKVTPQGYASMTRALVTRLGSARGRVVLVLEGGYNLESISKSFASCASVMIDHAAGAAGAGGAAVAGTASGDHGLASSRHQSVEAAAAAAAAAAAPSKGYRKTVDDARRLHSRYWKSLRGPISGSGTSMNGGGAALGARAADANADGPKLAW